jgi:hypothetical protein
VDKSTLTIILLACVCAALAIYALANLLKKARRLHTEELEISQFFGALGWTHLAHLFAALSNRDWPTAVGEFKLLARTLHDPAQRATLITSAVTHALPAVLSDVASRAPAVKALSDWIAANPEAAAKAGLAVVAPK